MFPTLLILRSIFNPFSFILIYLLTLEYGNKSEEEEEKEGLVVAANVADDEYNTGGFKAYRYRL